METYEEAIRFLAELCDEHNAMMRSKHWLPTQGNREKHEARELGICDALTILREHNDMLEGRIESLNAALNEREDEQEHVDVFAEEPDGCQRSTHIVLVELHGDEKNLDFTRKILDEAGNMMVATPGHRLNPAVWSMKKAASARSLAEGIFMELEEVGDVPRDGDRYVFMYEDGTAKPAYNHEFVVRDGDLTEVKPFRGITTNTDKASDFGDETEAMERFEKAQREADTREAETHHEAGEPEGESCAPCAAARAAAAADAALEG